MSSRVRRWFPLASCKTAASCRRGTGASASAWIWPGPSPEIKWNQAVILSAWACRCHSTVEVLNSFWAARVRHCHLNVGVVTLKIWSIVRPGIVRDCFCTKTVTSWAASCFLLLFLTSSPFLKRINVCSTLQPFIISNCNSCSLKIHLQQLCSHVVLIHLRKCAIALVSSCLCPCSFFDNCETMCNYTDTYGCIIIQNNNTLQIHHLTAVFKAGVYFDTFIRFKPLPRSSRLLLLCAEALASVVT